MKKILAALIVVFMLASLVMAGTVAAEGPRHGGKGPGVELSEMEDFRTGQKGKVRGEEAALMMAGMQAPEDLGIFQLTEKDGGCRQPMFSPDGTKIAYMYGEQIKYGGPPYSEIWVMELDFSSDPPVVVNDYPVTDGDDQCANLEGWSPDGTKILFRSYNPDFDWDSNPYVDRNRLWIANANGSGVYQLKAGIDDGSCFGGPTLYQASYSPDGSKIVYTMGYYLNPSCDDWSDKDIYVMNANGTGAVQLTDTYEECELSPRWSPDGSQILYKKCDDNNTSDLCVMDADGSNQHVVVSGVSANFFDWSPDGQYIVYECKKEGLGTSHIQEPGIRDIYKVRPDGSENTRMTPSDDYCEHTALWATDGTILYRSDELKVEGSTSFSSTWVMRPDGSEKTMINPWGGKWHDWSPGGEWIAFQTCEPTGGENDIRGENGGDEQIFIMANPLYMPSPVGGEAYLINKISALAPWIALSLAIVAGTSILIRRRRTKS